MTYILLKNGLVLTFKNGDPNAHALQADVLVKNDTIVDVKEGLEVPDGSEGEVVDCTGKWITPGQIDTHRHVWMSIMRGQQADWTLVEYMFKMACFQTPYVTASEAHIGTLAGCLEAISNGITTIVDHAHVLNTPAHAPTMIDAHIQSGIRSRFCYGRSTPVPANFAFTKEREEEFRTWQLKQLVELALEGEKNGFGMGMLSDRVGLGLAYDALRGSRPHEDNVEAHKEVFALARKYRLSPITTHFSETPSGAYFPGPKVYSDVGVLGSDVLFSHANGMQDEEWQLMKASGAAIASTPEDELGMGHGYPVAYEAVKKGVRVGLGCDCVSIQSADLFTQMRVALQWQRGQDHALLAQSRKPPLRNDLTSASAFRLATLGGAEAIHQEDKLGTIEPGKLADIVIIDADNSMNLAGAIDPIQGYVFWAKGEDVQSVLVNGEWVKRDGKLTKVRWEDVVGRLKEAMKTVESRRKKGEEGEAAYNQALHASGCVTQ